MILTEDKVRICKQSTSSCILIVSSTDMDEVRFKSSLREPNSSISANRISLRVRKEERKKTFNSNSRYFVREKISYYLNFLNRHLGRTISSHAI